MTSKSKLNQIGLRLDDYGTATEPWRRDDGSIVACFEKIKVMGENISELRQLAQDALEDALLMGCGEAQVRAALHCLVDELVNPYANEDA